MKYFFVIACSILVFSNCFNNKPPKYTVNGKLQINFTELGQNISKETFATLSSNLQNAMKEGGVSNAVKYCNLAASPLVDSLEQKHNVSIKRTSLKVRNLKNQPTDHERRQLEKYQQEFIAGEVLEPVVTNNQKHTAFYAPIHIMPMC